MYTWGKLTGKVSQTTLTLKYPAHEYRPRTLPIWADSIGVKDCGRCARGAGSAPAVDIQQGIAAGHIRLSQLLLVPAPTLSRLIPPLPLISPIRTHMTGFAWPEGDTRLLRWKGLEREFYASERP